MRACNCEQAQELRKNIAMQHEAILKLQDSLKDAEREVERLREYEFMYLGWSK